MCWPVPKGPHLSKHRARLALQPKAKELESTAMRAAMLQEAKLLRAKNNNNMYFIEYTVKKPSQDEKHLLSAIALGFNGRQVGP